MPTNDNDHPADGARTPSADAQGRAALLLVESLIHGLCEKTSLSTAEAIEITERALNVQLDHLQEADGATTPMKQAHTLLSSILLSLRTDARDGEDGGPPLPRLVT